MKKRTKLVLQTLGLLLNAYFFYSITHGTLFYLGYSRVDFYNILSISIGVFVSWYLFLASIRLVNKKYSADRNTLRHAIRVLLTTMVVCGLHFLLHNFIYVTLIFKASWVEIRMWTLHFPLFFLNIIAWNLLYQFYHAYFIATHEGQPESTQPVQPESQVEMQQTITAIKGRSKVVVRKGEVLFFKINNKLLYLVTDKGERLVVQSNIQEMEDMFRQEHFFRLNRQYLSSRKGIRSFKPIENRKLEVELESEDIPVIVSRYKAVEFKSWIAQGA